METLTRMSSLHRKWRSARGGRQESRSSARNLAMQNIPRQPLFQAAALCPKHWASLRQEKLEKGGRDSNTETFHRNPAG
jgi:hypothetical protein